MVTELGKLKEFTICSVDKIRHEEVRVYQEVSVVADGPARRATVRAPCCRQRWTLSVTD